jgi:beta,beta-carotene 9',10'-dioxygenase
MSNAAVQAVSAREAGAQPDVSKAAVQPGVLDYAPFRWTQRDAHTLPVTVTGSVPSWLRGALVRTAPAIFQGSGWHAAHWFDGLGLMYGFTLDERITFTQRALDCDTGRRLAHGDATTAGFGTPMRRSLWQRLRAPIPRTPDNANVNVVPWQGAWLAMTETPLQHVIGADDLRSRGLYAYEDRLPSSLAMTAHPHFDFTRRAMINVGTSFGPKNELWILRHATSGRQREVEGKLSLKRIPYLHDFGLTDRHAVLIAHPLTINPLTSLFSNKGYIEHFRWRPERGTTLWKFDRKAGTWKDYQTDALFCFHTVNTFEDGEDVVLDFLAYDDASVIDYLKTDRLDPRALVTQLPRYVRARLSPGKTHATLETLSDARFELPNIAYRAHHGRPYGVAWGATLRVDSTAAPTSDIVRVDLAHGDVRRFSDPHVTYGEPVFVPRPGSTSEDDGVVLTVGSDPRSERSLLAVLDAGTLAPLARCEVQLSLPLGFHGNFQQA